MTSSVPTPAELIDSFPETPSKIIGTPTYNTLKDLGDTLKTNAASVDTLLGGGICGHLGLVLPFHVYNTIVPHQEGTNAWIDPHYPGLQPAFPLNATNDQIATIKAGHEEQMRLWKLETK